MSADTPESSAAGDAEADAEELTEAKLRARVEELEDSVARLEADADDGPKKLTIIATKGTFDMAYPPLILASTAAAFGWEVVVFHTFWGLDILHEENSKSLQLSAVGNPNMPMPNALAALPGMDRMATKLMERRIDDNGTATIEELVEVSLEQGVELQACQMTIDLMDYDEDDFYDEVVTGVGAATALQHMAESDVQLLV
ncbi:DsrE/DsrF/DrsH-like family protein [Halobaculum magnesiiphilum]|uniref:DsrE/DsrF/DrsH-like family protein n=1 Tax=Halobaculum magnesiiphilum TaxID=1017351 RepID=A0A8T8WI10_9EURY|nr:DsrE/DsrF/DrsH-like family protein [Halobaculum magnesiiphilum]QZP39477.1 DsrE/DsrF/DrsH-like family protein [Halobaculum magnesiiphilum]